MDVAIVDARGACQFAQLPPPPKQPNTKAVTSWLGPVTCGPASGDIIVIDGPLGLAARGAPMRRCEQLLGTPGKTPARLPTPGSRPFAGYVRGSVVLARALVRANWVPACRGVNAVQATLLEAFPGGTWGLLAGARMPHKATAAGISLRTQLLSKCGLNFSRPPCTHDELDAALCAWLGWKLRGNPGSVIPVGRPCWWARGWLREGVILQLPYRVASSRPARSRNPRPTVAARMPVGVHVDWIYFATAARANRRETAELALDDGVICRPVHNSKGARIANVSDVRPGDVILLVYSHGRRSQAIGAFLVVTPPAPVKGVPAVHLVTEAGLSARLGRSYPPDPKLKRHTVFLVDPVWTPEGGSPIAVTRPKGHNALWRAI